MVPHLVHSGLQNNSILGKSYQFRQPIILFQKVDSLRLIHVLSSKGSQKQVSAHGLIFYSKSQLLSISLDVFKCLIAKKIENFQKRALSFLYDYELSYEELLLKSDRATMNVNRLRILCTKIYNTTNSQFDERLFQLKRNYQTCSRKIYVVLEYTSA